jgi:hypothetical protein
MEQTVVEWLYERLERMIPRTISYDIDKRQYLQQAKEMEKEQRGYTEEQVYQFWKAGQKYWETSGKSITFEELLETFNTNEK